MIKTFSGEVYLKSKMVLSGQLKRVILGTRAHRPRRANLSFENKQTNKQTNNQKIKYTANKKFNGEKRWVHYQINGAFENL